MHSCHDISTFLLQVLLESFEYSAKMLQELAEKNKRRVDKLGHVCLKQEKEHAARIGDLQGLYEVCPGGRGGVWEGCTRYAGGKGGGGEGLA